MATTDRTPDGPEQTDIDRRLHEEADRYLMAKSPEHRAELIAMLNAELDAREQA